MLTILVTGASGFVGSRFVQRWNNEYNILTPTHAELDITDDESVQNYFLQHRPNVVLHLAAISNTWRCEQEPLLSYAVNVDGAERIARAAAACYAKFIFFSSDQVYNGNLEYGLLREDVIVTPETEYARQKLKAEEKVLTIHPDAVILRATWMYDNPNSELPIHHNFVSNIETAVRDKKPLSVSMREYRGITWVQEVVEFLPRTFSLLSGIYNYGAANRLNTYETACCYFEMLDCGLRCDDIILADAERFPTHERNISISNEKIFNLSGGAIFFSDTLDGLRVFLQNRAG